MIALWVPYIEAQEAQQTDITKTKAPPQGEPVVRKRDPFKPFIKMVEEKEAEPQLSKSIPPIRRYALEQFRLAGIVWIGKQSKAMVIDPEKNTYVIGIGDEIGNRQGKIVEVRDNGILVEETTYFEDVFGQKRVETRKSLLAFKEE